MVFDTYKEFPITVVNKDELDKVVSKLIKHTIEKHDGKIYACLDKCYGTLTHQEQIILLRGLLSLYINNRRLVSDVLGPIELIDYDPGTIGDNDNGAIQPPIIEAPVQTTEEPPPRRRDVDISEELEEVSNYDDDAYITRLIKKATIITGSIIVTLIVAIGLMQDLILEKEQSIIKRMWLFLDLIF